jgi:hypothetical protein
MKKSKIAIKGNQLNASKVISTLRHKGGRNYYQWSGNDETAFYFIKGGIIRCEKKVPDGYIEIELK